MRDFTEKRPEYVAIDFQQAQDYLLDLNRQADELITQVNAQVSTLLSHEILVKKSTHGAPEPIPEISRTSTENDVHQYITKGITALRQRQLRLAQASGIEKEKQKVILLNAVKGYLERRYCVHNGLNGARLEQYLKTANLPIPYEPTFHNIVNLAFEGNEWSSPFNGWQKWLFNSKKKRMMLLVAINYKIIDINQNTTQQSKKLSRSFDKEQDRLILLEQKITQKLAQITRIEQALANRHSNHLIFLKNDEYVAADYRKRNHPASPPIPLFFARKKESSEQVNALPNNCMDGSNSTL